MSAEESRIPSRRRACKARKKAEAEPSFPSRKRRKQRKLVKQCTPHSICVPHAYRPHAHPRPQLQTQLPTYHTQNTQPRTPPFSDPPPQNALFLPRQSFACSPELVPIVNALPPPLIPPPNSLVYSTPLSLLMIKAEIQRCCTQNIPEETGGPHFHG